MANETKTHMKIRICPFCGHHGQELEEFTFGSKHGCSTQMWHVHCRCCGATGPSEFNQQFAVESWNHIYNHPAHTEDPEMKNFSIEIDDETNEERLNNEQ